MEQSSYGTQNIEGPITPRAIFLTVIVDDAVQGAFDVVRGVLGGLSDLVKTVGFRAPTMRLTCTVGVGANAWDHIFGNAKPQELRAFPRVQGDMHTAVSTPGDLLFHIRAEREDLAYEFERLLLQDLGAAVKAVDEVAGFRYFDNRDLLGFVDGTANPIGPNLPASALVGEEDPDFAGGSYIVTQKYLHRLDAWQAISTDEQEQVMGRTKLDNVELDDADGDAQKSHKTLATITDDAGEHDIVRDNMPFSRPAHHEHGTYFIGYSRHLWVVEKMLERMFIGVPPGKHDRLLDFSTAVTGNVFFAPTAETLSQLDS